MCTFLPRAPSSITIYEIDKFAARRFSPLRPVPNPATSGAFRYTRGARSQLGHMAFSPDAPFVSDVVDSCGSNETDVVCVVLRWSAHSSQLKNRSAVWQLQGASGGSTLDDVASTVCAPYSGT